MKKNLTSRQVQVASEYDQSHTPVMLADVIELLAIKPDGLYIDATFGRGGHAKEILKQLDENGRLLVIDKDPEAIAAAKKINNNRLIIRQGSFTMLSKWTTELNWQGRVCGILLDLGVSSPQLANAKRGFSFMQDGPLDMRMDPNQETSAADWLNVASVDEIALVLRNYGEERFSKRVAMAIVREREIAPINTTARLARIVANSLPRRLQHKHPATRTFQAIRIHVNNELDELKNCLKQCLEVLAQGGRLAVISFHSLEDRIVKQFIKHQVEDLYLPAKVPVRGTKKKKVRQIGKALRSSDRDVAYPRSRSAVLRVVEKAA